jgi:hypothetical protein
VPTLRKKTTYYHTFIRMNHTFFRMFYTIILNKYVLSYVFLHEILKALPVKTYDYTNKSIAILYFRTIIRFCSRNSYNCTFLGLIGVHRLDDNCIIIRIKV